MPKLVVLMRVKDGILFLDRWLGSIEKIVDEIIVVDNGSTDGTLERLKIHSKVASLDQTVGFHQGRDDNLLLQRAQERYAEWILYLDVDEVFEDRVTRDHFDHMMADSKVNQYRFRRFNHHRDIHHFEGGWKKLWEIAKPDRLLWRNRPSVYFPNEKIHVFPGGFTGKTKTSHLRLRHFGAMHRDYYVQKMNNYIAIDPGRTPMYLEHRDHQLPVCHWYEFRDHPFRVEAQQWMLDLLLLLRFLSQKLMNAFHRMRLLRHRINPLPTERPSQERALRIRLSFNSRRAAAKTSSTEIPRMQCASSAEQYDVHGTEAGG